MQVEPILHIMRRSIQVEVPFLRAGPIHEVTVRPVSKELDEHVGDADDGGVWGKACG